MGIGSALRLVFLAVALFAFNRGLDYPWPVGVPQEVLLHPSESCLAGSESIAGELRASSASATCSAELRGLRGGLLVVGASGDAGAIGEVILEDMTGRWEERRTVRFDSKTGSYRLVFELPEGEAELRYRLRLSARAVPQDAALRLAPVATAFAVDAAFVGWLRRLPGHLMALFCGLIAVALCFVGFQDGILPKSRTGFWVLCCILAVSIHFWWGGYFYLDEWETLARLSTHGIGGATMPHNEHLIPVFVAFYSLERLLFGSAYEGYVLLSCLLHLMNVAMVFSLSRRLSQGDERVSRVAALFFAACPLATATVQYAFQQTALLALSLTLVGILSLLHFVREGRGWLLSFGAFILAPFSFAAALVSPLQGALSVGLVWVRQTPAHSSRVKQAMLLCAGAAALSGGIYGWLWFCSGISPEHQPIDLVGAAAGVAVGVVVGGVARVLSIFPILPDESSIRLLLGMHEQYGTFWLLSGLSLLAAFAGAFFTSSSQDVRPQRSLHSGGLFLFSLLWVALALALPALGRGHDGALVTLALRYYYLPLVGLALIVALVLDALGSGESRPQRLVGRFLLVAVVAVQLIGRVELARSMDHGLTARTYLLERDVFCEADGSPACLRHASQFPPLPTGLPDGKVGTERFGRR
ncbi:MAG: hypothetical protein KDD44_02205 [Bdellovibrionales bacterium]|nr:hypothetical protein [Bdellovibrionales bacterium]